MAVLALVTWAFTGALGGGGNAPSGAGHAGAGARIQAGGSHGGSGRAGAGGAVQGRAAQGSTGLSGAAAARGSGARAHSGTGAATRRHGPRVADGRPQPCPAGDVVLSLFSSQDSYGAGQLPQFDVDVVATAGQTCTFDVGARHLALIIRAGSVRVWNSADCVQGAGSLVSDLQRGVPTVLPISWNRAASAPGCPAGTSRMPAGTYTATVTDGALASNPVTFRIS
jgi:hypothetical protein